MKVSASAGLVLGATACCALTFTLPEANVHGWYTEDLVASVRVTSSISSTALIEWSTSGAQVGSGESVGSASIPISTGGQTVLTVTATDEEGNTVGPTTRRIKLDKTAPNNVLLAPSRPVYRLGDSVMLQYTCDDPESGINACGATIIDNTTRPDGYVRVLDQLGTFEARAHGGPLGVQDGEHDRVAEPVTPHLVLAQDPVLGGAQLGDRRSRLGVGRVRAELHRNAVQVLERAGEEQQLRGGVDALAVR